MKQLLGPRTVKNLFSAWSRRQINRLRWVFGVDTIRHSSHEHKRLLIIYDFSTQPFSIGDILIFQEIALVQMNEWHLDKVDFALVYAPEHPVVADPAFSHLDSESFLFHLSAFLPAAQVNPRLGSVLLFDSHSQLESYIVDNAAQYRVWPESLRYAAREYLYYQCFNELLPAYFRKYGSLPTLQSRPAAITWANHFLRRHANGLTPVTIQLRRNPQNPQRDSSYDAWFAFFVECETRYAAKFIVICGHSEIDPRLRGSTNVLIAKDYGTTVEQDLALIEAAAIHLGAASGPGTMAQFSNKPYCIFNSTMGNDFVAGFKVDGNRGRFEFSTPLQSWITDRETPALLASEFKRLWDASQATHNLDKEGVV